MSTLPTSVAPGDLPVPQTTADRPVSSLIPPDLADVEPASLNVREPIIAGLIVILLAFGGIGTWAALAPLESTVVTGGTVIVEGNAKTVQHLEGGIVKELLVRDGDRVEAGDVLVRLEEVQTQASFALFDNQLAAARALEARLIAERDEKPSVTFPEDLVALSADRPEAVEVLTAQRRQFEERRKSISGQIDILRSRIDQYRQEIKGLKVQKASKERQVEIYEDELKGLRELFEKGYTPRTRILAMEREVTALGGEIGSAVASIARSEKGIGEADLQIAQTRQKFREEVVSQLREVQGQVSDLRERVTVANDTLMRTDIRASQSGIIQNLTIHTIGGVIRPGEQLMHIVPLDAKLIVQAQVSPLDIDSVRVGQAAEVRFSAFHSRDIPTIEGDVSLVSADRITDERTGAPYYVVQVDVSESEITKLGDRRLVPGMPADVVIKTGERTALEYFLKPIEDFSMRAMTEK